MRVIADAIGIEAEEYQTVKAVESTDKIYTGYQEIVVDDELVEQFYNDEEIRLDEEL
jgi:predicted ribonuclease YlaK